MIEMAAALIACLVLAAIATEIISTSTRKWGENFKSFF
jgi:hypothetical protein